LASLLVLGSGFEFLALLTLGLSFRLLSGLSLEFKKSKGGVVLCLLGPFGPKGPFRQTARFIGLCQSQLEPA
jgi:hypothetical protein